MSDRHRICLITIDTAIASRSFFVYCIPHKTILYYMSNCCRISISSFVNNYRTHPYMMSLTFFVCFFIIISKTKRFNETTLSVLSIRSSPTWVQVYIERQRRVQGLD